MIHFYYEVIIRTLKHSNEIRTFEVKHSNKSSEILCAFSKIFSQQTITITIRYTKMAHATKAMKYKLKPNKDSIKVDPYSFVPNSRGVE